MSGDGKTRDVPPVDLSKFNGAPDWALEVIKQLTAYREELVGPDGLMREAMAMHTKLERVIGGLNEWKSGIETQITEMRRHVDTRFDTLERRVVSGVDAKVAALKLEFEERLCNLQREFDERFERIENSINLAPPSQSPKFNG